MCRYLLFFEFLILVTKISGGSAVLFTVEATCDSIYVRIKMELLPKARYALEMLMAMALQTL